MTLGRRRLRPSAKRGRRRLREGCLRESGNGVSCGIQTSCNHRSLERREVKFAPRMHGRAPSRNKTAFRCNSGSDGAPGKIRTPDPQIRSLVLYPAELPVQALKQHSEGGPLLKPRPTEGKRKAHPQDPLTPHAFGGNLRHPLDFPPRKRRAPPRGRRSPPPGCRAAPAPVRGPRFQA